MALSTQQRYLSNLVASGDLLGEDLGRYRYEVLWVSSAARLVGNILIGVFASWELAPDTYAKQTPISKQIIRDAIRDDAVKARIPIADYFSIKGDDPSLFANTYAGFELILEGAQISALNSLLVQEIENLSAVRIRVAAEDVSSVVGVVKKLSIPPGKIIFEPSAAAEILTIEQLGSLYTLGKIHPDRNIQTPQFLVSAGSNPTLHMADIAPVLESKTLFLPTATLEIVVEDLESVLKGFSISREFKNVQKILLNVNTAKPTITFKQFNFLLNHQDKIDVRNGDSALEGYNIRLNSVFELKKLVFNTNYAKSLEKYGSLSISLNDVDSKADMLRISTKQLKSLQNVLDDVDGNSLLEVWVSSSEKIAELPELKAGFASAVRINLDTFPMKVSLVRELVAKGYQNIIFDGSENGTLNITSEHFPDFSYFEGEWFYLLKKIGYDKVNFSFPIQLDPGAMSWIVANKMHVVAPESSAVLISDSFKNFSFGDTFDLAGIDKLLVIPDPMAVPGSELKIKDTDFEQLVGYANNNEVRFRDLGLKISESEASKFTQDQLQQFIKISGLLDLSVSPEEGIFFMY
jgi:hypothetical protein